MASRFSRDDRESRDPRFNSRDRSPPPRFGDRRGSGPFGPGYGGRDGPRDGLNNWQQNNQLGSRPHGNRFEVRGGGPAPRGRGFAPRPDFRDRFDGRASPTDRRFNDRNDGPPTRNERWHNEESDRGFNHRPRSRSPPPVRELLRDRIEPRDPVVRGPESDRPRRNSRDGPPTMISHLPDNRGPPPAHRGNFGGPRLSGGNRHEWEQKRDRFGEMDDREGSRGPGRMRGNLHDGDRQGDARDFNRREDPRDRRDEDRWNNGDKSVAQSPMETRFRPTANQSTATDLQIQRERPVYTPPPFDRPAMGRDLSHFSRDAGGPDSVGPRELRADAPDHTSSRPEPVAKEDDSNRTARPDLLAGRAESARYTVRPSSPPPAAPAVPAFGGGAPWFQNTHRSNVWRNPATQKPALSTVAPNGAEPTPSGSKVPPSAPRSQLQAAPPTAPRAERLTEKTSSEDPISEDKAKTVSDAMPSPSQPSQVPFNELQPSPVMSARSNSIERQGSLSSSFSSKQHLAPPIAPLAPRAMTSTAAPFGKSPPLGHIGRDPSPAFTVPSGPRASAIPHTSPKSMLNFIPKGPKANRGPIAPLNRGPPTAPRAQMMDSRQSVSPALTWKGLGPQATPSKATFGWGGRQGSVGEVQGFRRPSSSHSNPEASAYSVQKMPRLEGMTSVRSRSISKSPPPEKKHDVQPTAVVMPEQKESTTSKLEPEPTEPTVPHIEAAGSVLEEDPMELEEGDFAIHETKFKRERDRLEAKKIDVSAPEFSSIPILLPLSRLIQMRAVLDQIEFAPPPTVVVAVKEQSPLPIEQRIEQDNVASQDSDVDMADAQSSDAESSIPIEQPIYDGETPLTPLEEKAEHYGNRFAELDQLLRPVITRQDRDYRTEQARLEAEYERLYWPWRRQTEELGGEQAVISEHSQPPSPRPAVSTPIFDMPAFLIPTPSGERGRAHRFSSQLDIERAIEQSRREYQEKQEKEAEQIKEVDANPDKEADIPDMLEPAQLVRHLYRDQNQMRENDQALRAFELMPQLDAFNKEEDKLMRELYPQHPKIWGKIAAIIQERLGSGRTYKECINHYYAAKWEKPFKKPVGKKGRAKGVKRAVKGRTAGVYAMADVNIDGDTDGKQNDSAGQTTDSGRPRRAAAPKHFGEKEAETAAMNAAAMGHNGQITMGVNRGQQLGVKGEGLDPSAVPEKTGRRKAPKEKGPRKSRPVAAKPLELSPTKSDLSGKMMMEQTEAWPSLQNVPVPDLGARLTAAPMQFARQDAGLGPVPDVVVPRIPSPMLQTIERPRAYSQNTAAPQTARAGASSYWSVAEEQLFKDCLGHFGTDFGAIASHMESKTQTMIKNRFDKYVSSGKHPDLILAARSTDDKRSRNEDMGPPPDAVSQAQRKRPQAAAAGAATRVLAPSLEAEKFSASRQAVQIPPSSPQVIANAIAALPQGSPPAAVPSAHQTPMASFAQIRKPQLEGGLGFQQRLSREEAEANLANENILRTHGRQISRGSSGAGSSTPRSMVADYQPRSQLVAEQIKNEQTAADKPFAGAQTDFGPYVGIQPRPSEQASERPLMQRNPPLHQQMAAPRQQVLALSPKPQSIGASGYRELQPTQPQLSQLSQLGVRGQEQISVPQVRSYAESADARGHREYQDRLAQDRLAQYEAERSRLDRHSYGQASAIDQHAAMLSSRIDDRSAPYQQSQSRQPIAPAGPSSQAPAPIEARPTPPAPKEAPRRVNIMDMLNNDAPEPPRRRDPPPPVAAEPIDRSTPQYLGSRPYSGSSQIPMQYPPPTSSTPLSFGRQHPRDSLPGRASIAPSPAQTPAATNLASPHLPHLQPYDRNQLIEARHAANDTPPPSSNPHSRHQSVAHMLPQSHYGSSDSYYQGSAQQRSVPTSGSMFHQSHPHVLSAGGRHTPPPPMAHLDDRQLQSRYEPPPTQAQDLRAPDIRSRAPEPRFDERSRGGQGYEPRHELARAEERVQQRLSEREARVREQEHLDYQHRAQLERERDQQAAQQQQSQQPPPYGAPLQHRPPVHQGLHYPHQQHIQPESSQPPPRPPHEDLRYGSQQSQQQYSRGGQPERHDVFSGHHHGGLALPLQSRASLEEVRRAQEQHDRERGAQAQQEQQRRDWERGYGHQR